MKEAAPTTWGDLAAERDTLIDALEGVREFNEACQAYENAAYRGDGKKLATVAREKMNQAVRNAEPIILKYRR